MKVHRVPLCFAAVPPSIAIKEVVIGNFEDDCSLSCELSISSSSSSKFPMTTSLLLSSLL